jgi:hypothetical protein
LDHKLFAERQKASDELEKLGEAVEPALKKALEGKPALEVRQRIDSLLEKLKGSQAERRREVRAVDVLELVRTPEARQRLIELAKGRNEAGLTRAAAAALERLP